MKKRIIAACLFLVFNFTVIFLINNLVPDVSVSEVDLGKQLRTSSGQETDDYESMQDAGEALRKALKERETEITLKLTGTETEESDYNDVFNQIYNIALEHTGVGDEGDYLKWHLNKISVTYAKSSSTFEVTVEYLDDASMEQQATQAVQAAEQELPITSEDSTYEKIYTIYDYLANHITYDKEDESNLPHTAYDAIVNGKAVCQGYAMVFYRMLLDYGIDNRIVVSDTHAWNLVCLDEQYYECDLTWDSQEIQEGGTYSYFLKSDLSAGNTSHDWKMDVMDDEVSQLNRSETDYDDQDGESTLFDIKQAVSSLANFLASCLSG